MEIQVEFNCSCLTLINNSSNTCLKLSLQRTWKCPKCGQKGAGFGSKCTHHANHVKEITRNFHAKVDQYERDLTNNRLDVVQKAQQSLKNTIKDIKDCRM